MTFISRRGRGVRRVFWSNVVSMCEIYLLIPKGFNMNNPESKFGSLRDLQKKCIK